MHMEPKSGAKGEVLQLIRNSLDRTLAEIPPVIAGRTCRVARPSVSDLEVRDVVEGDNLVEAIDLYFDLLDGVIAGADDYYQYLTPEQATEIGLTPIELKRLNSAIDDVNTAVAGLASTGLPLGAPRSECMLFLATRVAYAPPAGLILPVLGLIWRILVWLWKLLKLLGNARKHVRRIRAAQRARRAGTISAGTARAVIAARLAALALLIADMVAAIEAARRLIEELRRQGRSQEADDLEERVRDMEERLRELQSEYDELRQQEQGSGESGASGSGG
ncbi:MAG: bZIP transcription factor [Candidatus Tectimicrobiota bacterium]